MTTEILTIDQLIEALENTKDNEKEDLYVVIGEPVGSNLSITFDGREEAAEIESTQGWAHSAFAEDVSAMTFQREFVHYLFGSLLVEERYLSDDAIAATRDGESA